MIINIPFFFNFLIVYYHHHLLHHHHRSQPMVLYLQHPPKYAKPLFFYFKNNHLDYLIHLDLYQRTIMMNSCQLFSYRTIYLSWIDLSKSISIIIKYSLKNDFPYILMLVLTNRF